MEPYHGLLQTTALYKGVSVAFHVSVRHGRPSTHINIYVYTHTCTYAAHSFISSLQLLYSTGAHCAFCVGLGGGTRKLAPCQRFLPNPVSKSWFRAFEFRVEVLGECGSGTW